MSQIDSKKALQWLDGDEKVFARMKTIFVKNIPPQVVQLGEFLSVADNESAERAAHTIMGSSAMLGATAMSEAAGKIERSVMAGDKVSAMAHFSTFVLEYEKVMDELSADGGV